ncbi:unnamed protein product [Schistosoma margrebowiei]|uniref:Uncharacterized protein n=1 Tax=Schistosoma margrebowiei TaxID=48269 RepID=A0A3P8AIY7_9TREM|nr:unnamed protein product [Schistosoma margrebowiei]
MELPPDFIPVSSDGEVDSFRLASISEFIVRPHRSKKSRCNLLDDSSLGTHDSTTTTTTATTTTSNNNSNNNNGKIIINYCFFKIQKPNIQTSN